MLEEELEKEKKNNPNFKEARDASEPRSNIGSDIKKSFLKRKSHNLLDTSAKKGNCTTAKKSYKYYADNFKKDDIKPRKLDFDDDASDNKEQASRNQPMKDKSATQKADQQLIEIVVNEKKRNPFSSEKKSIRGFKSNFNMDKKDPEIGDKSVKEKNQLKTVDFDDEPDSTRANKTPTKSARKP